MDFFNIPSAPSPEFTQDKHMNKQEEILNEIKELQLRQMQLLEKMDNDNKHQSKYEHRSNTVIIIVAVLTLIATLIQPLAALIL